AAISNGSQSDWWSGGYLENFLIDQTSTIPWYRAFLDFAVEPLSAGVSVFVIAVEVAVGFALLLNYRPLVALAVGSVLNLNFMLAGAVNPSAFYMVIAGAMLLWHIDSGVPMARKQVVFRWSAIAAVGSLVLLGPFVREIAPMHVIEDTAMVLIFVAVLFAGSMWWMLQHPVRE
ncbi:MAG: hypothetical protein HKN07_02070, partial [Acidimicrobiia bacterium]|nr:hypothetical protein [Acidimicrobiia bacterium]